MNGIIGMPVFYTVAFVQMSSSVKDQDVRDIMHDYEFSFRVAQVSQAYSNHYAKTSALGGIGFDVTSVISNCWYHT